MLFKAFFYFILKFLFFLRPPMNFIFENNVCGGSVNIYPKTRPTPHSTFLPPPFTGTQPLSYHPIVLHNGNPGWNNSNQ